MGPSHPPWALRGSAENNKSGAGIQIPTPQKATHTLHYNFPIDYWGEIRYNGLWAQKFLLCGTDLNRGSCIRAWGVASASRPAFITLSLSRTLILHHIDSRCKRFFAVDKVELLVVALLYHTMGLRSPVFIYHKKYAPPRSNFKNRRGDYFRSNLSQITFLALLQI